MGALQPGARRGPGAGARGPRRGDDHRRRRLPARARVHHRRHRPRAPAPLHPCDLPRDHGTARPAPHRDRDAGCHRRRPRPGRRRPPPGLRLRGDGARGRRARARSFRRGRRMAERALEFTDPSGRPLRIECAPTLAGPTPRRREPVWAFPSGSTGRVGGSRMLSAASTTAPARARGPAAAGAGGHGEEAVAGRLIAAGTTRSSRSTSRCSRWSTTRRAAATGRGRDLPEKAGSPRRMAGEATHRSSDDADYDASRCAPLRDVGPAGVVIVRLG